MRFCFYVNDMLATNVMTARVKNSPIAGITFLKKFLHIIRIVIPPFWCYSDKYTHTHLIVMIYKRKFLI